MVNPAYNDLKTLKPDVHDIRMLTKQYISYVVVYVSNGFEKMTVWSFLS